MNKYGQKAEANHSWIWQSYDIIMPGKNEHIHAKKEQKKKERKGIQKKIEKIMA